MTHRHLLPDEIDLLLDDELGFGVNPLKAHVRECAECRARLDEARWVVGTLEDLPHLAPSHTFASQIMSQVPVFVPWHVAARDSIHQWLPRSRPARLVVGTLATVMASILTIAILWISTQTNSLQLASGVASDGAQRLVLSVGHRVLGAVFGEHMYAMIVRTGWIGLTGALLCLAAATVGAIASLRLIAGVSSRRRS